MSDENKPPPDFAMLRAVEILAQIAEKMLSSEHVLPPSLDVPIILFNEHIMFTTGMTPQANIVKALGPGYAFPTKGWETYAIRERNKRYLLSALYRDGMLVAVDYYVAGARAVPELRNQDFGEFRLVPGQIGIGSEISKLDGRFVLVPEGPDGRIYLRSFECRYKGGVAFVQSDTDVVQRIVLYAVDAK